MRSIQLSEAARLYEAARNSEGRSHRTVDNDRFALRKLIESTGDLQVTSVTPGHIDRFFLRQDGAWGPTTMNQVQSSLSGFFGWCRRRQITPRHFDPLAERAYRRPAPKDRARVPLSKFPLLLSVAGQASPRHRVLTSVGLYLFLRASEIQLLRVRDVDLDSGEIRVTVTKGYDRDRPLVDYMPISAELDRELRSWLRYYTEQAGRLDPNWFLIPTVSKHSQSKGPDGRFTVVPLEHQRLIPERRICRPQELIHDVLEAVGMPTRDATGKAIGEGLHTLRRSGARALYDELVGMGYDGALKRVSSMLHHRSVLMTEHYIGLNEERARRDKDIRGKALFPSLAADTVLTLSSGDSGSVDGGKDRASA